MAKEVRGGNAEKKAPKAKIIGFDQAFAIIKKGGRVAPAHVVSEDTGKVPWWVQALNTGQRVVLAQVHSGGVNTYGNLNNDLMGDWVEVSEEMM